MNSIFKKKNQVFSDIILNIIAAGLAAVIMQFIVYPLINRSTSSEIFGEVLVMMSVVNIVAVLLGNSLNNIRLIYDKEYAEQSISGDFNILLLIASVVNVVLMAGISLVLWSNNSILGNVLLILISFMTMLRSYLTVSYRLKLNYKMILQHSLVYSGALFLGALILLITDVWQFVFVIGETVSLLFLILTTDLIKEPMKISIKFKNTFKQYIYLSTSGLIGNVMLYLDRIIIFPFLGARQVAVFFAATVIGKMSSFVLSPVSGVVLSHLSKKQRKMSVKEFLIVNGIVLTFSLVILVLSLLLSKFVLKLLYSELYSEAIEILLLANSAAVLLASSSITQAIVLRYSSSKNQIFIQMAYGIIYIASGIYLIINFGLVGFCIAALMAAICKFLIIFFFGLRVLRNI